MKKHLSTILLVFILLLGLSLLLYPSVSDYWNSMHQSRAVASYVEQVATMDESAYDEIRREVAEYNHSLTQRNNMFLLSPEQQEDYNRLLDIGGTGIMGYIEIPSIQVSLPIYHGTSDAVLQVAVGHMEWTSLPGGGESTHCVLSGHRGLPSAKLFTDLDQLMVGDIFQLWVLDEMLTYQIDQILIVEPHDSKALLIEEGQDLCTLVTCTPYGVNSHRLLIRGHRVETPEEVKTALVTADAIQIEPMIVAPVVATPILLVLLVMLMLPKRKKS